MKKGIFCFMALLLMSVPSFGQFRSGVKGGGNLSNILMNFGGVDLEIYEPRMGVHAGFMVEYMFNPHFGLHSELGYFYSGATINPEKYTEGMEVSEGVSLEGYVSMHTFQLPLYLKTKFPVAQDCKLYVMGGGFASYSPAADQHVRMSSGEESLKVKWSLFEPDIRILDEEEGNIYMQQRWNVGLAAEAGVEIMDRITAGIGFRHVLNNMAAFGYFSGSGSIKPTTKMWTATVSVGYFF